MIMGTLGFFSGPKVTGTGENELPLTCAPTG